MKKKKNLLKKKSKSTGRQKKHRVVFSIGDGPVERTSEERLRDQCAALGVLGQAVIAELERQDRQDWEINRRDANEPMISDPVWYVHHRR